MDKENFLNSSMLPPLQFDHPFASTWQSNNISHDHFLSSPPTSENFDSTLCSMVSSPVASGSAISNDNLLIRELIGKLGNICKSDNVTPPSLPPHIGGIGGGNCSASNSNYSTPLTSPHKMSMPIMDQLIKQNFPTLENSSAFRSNLPAICGDPGFAERAARFSSLGSKSFNGRMTPFGANNGNEEFGYRSNNNFGVTTQLQRVCSSPSINYGKQIGNLISNQGELSNSRENSSISGQNPSGEIGTNKKRKAVNKGKAKENQTPLPTISNREVENDEESNAQRSKLEDAKTEENGGDENRGKQSNSNQKPPEPRKDYIHVRARRGQATDSHSLAERVRREKISERMKLLQDLVPGCNKVTGKALMLDEIINYVQSLQRQVEFLSMKLASVNPRLEFNMDNHFSKDVIQPNSSLEHPMCPIDSLATTLYGHPNQNGSQNSLTTTIGATMVPCPMDPLNPTLINQNNSMQLPLVDGFPNVVPQLSSLCEGDLHSIVQMSYGRKDNGFQSQPLHGTNRKPLMKAEF